MYSVKHAIRRCLVRMQTSSFISLFIYFIWVFCMPSKRHTRPALASVMLWEKLGGDWRKPQAAGWWRLFSLAMAGETPSWIRTHSERNGDKLQGHWAVLATIGHTGSCRQSSPDCPFTEVSTIPVFVHFLLTVVAEVCSIDLKVISSKNVLEEIYFLTPDLTGRSVVGDMHMSSPSHAGFITGHINGKPSLDRRFP